MKWMMLLFQGSFSLSQPTQAITSPVPVLICRGGIPHPVAPQRTGISCMHEHHHSMAKLSSNDVQSLYFTPGHRSKKPPFQLYFQCSCKCLRCRFIIPTLCGPNDNFHYGTTRELRDRFLLVGVGGGGGVDLDPYLLIVHFTSITIHHPSGLTKKHHARCRYNM